jgi:transposase
MTIDLANPPSDPALLHQVLRDLVGVLHEREVAIEERDAAIEERDARIKELEHQLAVLRRYQFGHRSEKVAPRQQLLFGEAAGAPEPPAPAPPAPKRKPNGHGRRPLPKDLPRERVEHDVAPEAKQCEKCGAGLEKIGEEVSEQLDYVPASFVVRQHVRLKYACKACEETIVLAPMPDQPICKGLPGPGLLAQVLVSKYDDHLPLYRQSEIYARQGVDLDRSTLCGWVRDSTRLLEPLVRAMSREVLASKVVQTDDTPVPVQERSHPGSTRTGRLWVYRGDAVHPYTVFDYTPNRKRDGPVSFLGDYTGYLQADAFGGYDGIYAGGKVIEVGCWAHTRRKFYDAQTTDESLATAALGFIGQLYGIEREARARGLDAAGRLALRQERARPVVEDLRRWLDAQALVVLPKSPMGQAIGYALDQWTALCRYLDDGDLEIDNNASERDERAVAVGRKNWLFAGSDAGGRRAAIAYSLIATCQRHKVNPFEYLRDVLVRVTTTAASRIRELLPPQWKAARQARQPDAPEDPTPPLAPPATE